MSILQAKQAKQAKQAAHRELGPKHPITLECVWGYAECLLNQKNRTEAALSLFQRTMRLRKEIFGPHNHQVYSSQVRVHSNTHTHTHIHNMVPSVSERRDPKARSHVYTGALAAHTDTHAQHANTHTHTHTQTHTHTCASLHT